MTTFRVTASCYDSRHQDGFLIDRPQGAGEYVFLHYLVPVMVLLSGRPEQVPAGACLLYTPEFPQWYHGDGVGLRNSWFHAQGVGVRRLVRQFGLPVNRPVKPYDDRFVEPALQEIRAEVAGGRPGAERACALRVELLLLELARSLVEPGAGPSTRMAELRERLRQVRIRMMNDYASRWTLETMSAEADLSPSRFSALYRKFFGVSPGEDLIRRRLEQARWLLRSSLQPVGEIADACGFNSAYYFSRLFARREGVPPTAYRQIARGEQRSL